MNHEYSHCASCWLEIYRNLDPQAEVKAWAHRHTGSKHCDFDGKPTVAEPEAEMTVKPPRHLQIVPDVALDL
jgi:hypothetical protein